MALACALLAGCHTQPTVEVAGARVTDRTPEALLIEFDLDAHNPNDFDLPLRDISYALTVDGRPAFRGVRAGEATLARGRTQRLVVPAVVPLDGTQPTTTDRYSLAGTIQYLTPGELADVLYDANLRRPTMTFSDRGVIDFGTGAVEPQPSQPSAEAQPAPPTTPDPGAPAPEADPPVERMRELPPR